MQSVPKFGTTVVIPGGLRGLIYHIPKDTARLPDFEKLKPVGSIYTSSLNIPPQDFRDGFPGVTKRFEWFAIDYTGRFWIDKPGLYTFVLTSDDGARLYIDGQLIIDTTASISPKTGPAASASPAAFAPHLQHGRFQAPAPSRQLARGSERREVTFSCPPVAGPNSGSSTGTGA
jgi:hypothetical protein